MLTEEEVKSVTPNKKCLHEALMRNGMMVPPYASKCITHEYLQGVKCGDFYVPLYDDVRIRPCPNPPVKRRIF